MGASEIIVYGIFEDDELDVDTLILFSTEKLAKEYSLFLLRKVYDFECDPSVYEKKLETILNPNSKWNLLFGNRDMAYSIKLYEDAIEECRKKKEQGFDVWHQLRSYNDFMPTRYVVNVTLPR